MPAPLVADRSTEEPRSPYWSPLVSKEGDSWVPNLSDWHAGDVLLFCKSAASKDIRGQTIQRLQTMCTGLAEGHTEWVHAAIYLRDGVCVESTRERGVCVELDSVGRRLGEGAGQIRVLRVRHTTFGEPWNQDIGWRIAMRALSYLSFGYPEFSRLVEEMLADVRPVAETVRELADGTEQTVYCSMLCAAAIAQSTGVDIAASEGLPPLPCVFSASTTYFEDVPVVWRRPR
jgi:hypothetical protein